MTILYQFPRGQVDRLKRSILKSQFTFWCQWRFHTSCSGHAWPVFFTDFLLTHGWFSSPAKLPIVLKCVRDIFSISQEHSDWLGT